MPKVDQLAVEPGCLVPSARILCSAWLSQDSLRCMAVGNMAMADPSPCQRCLQQAQGRAWLSQ